MIKGWLIKSGGMMEKRKSSKLIIGLVLIAAGVALLMWTLAGKKADAPANESEDSNSSNSKMSSVDQDKNNGSDNDPNASVSNESKEFTITFDREGFSPDRLEVELGTKITVKNVSSKKVQFSSDDHPTHRLNEGMNLKILAPGESSSFVANKAGTWGFHDHIDDSFTGTLVVTE